MTTPHLTVIGGGLAGPEAAWQAAERGITVSLYEMRPVKQTPAHLTATWPNWCAATRWAVICRTAPPAC
jgi:folate-dependent tRNA-U54 methylase TrmFO/GidA